MQIDNYKIELKFDKAWTRKFPQLEKSKMNEFGDTRRLSAAQTIFHAVVNWMHKKKILKV